jgi:hypothetical protein
MVSVELDLFLQACQSSERISWEFRGAELRALNLGVLLLWFYTTHTLG